MERPENHKIVIEISVNRKKRVFEQTRSANMPLPNLVSTIKDEAGKLAAWIIKDLGYLDGGVPEIQEVPIETSESSPRVLDAGVVPGVMLKEGELPEDSPLTKGKRIPPPIPERPVTKKAPPKKKASAKKKPIKPSTYKRKKK